MDFESKMAELKKLEEETFAEAKAEAAAIVAEVRGKVPSRIFTVMKFSGLEDSDWSAERYVPEAQARALESALDRPTTAGVVSAVKNILIDRCVRRVVSANKVNLSRRTMSVVEKSSIGKYAAKQAEDPAV